MVLTNILNLIKLSEEVLYNLLLVEFVYNHKDGFVAILSEFMLNLLLFVN